MPIGPKAPQLKELKPRIVVCGVGGAGGNAVHNMILSGVAGVDFVVANTDAQALKSSTAPRTTQMGPQPAERPRARPLPGGCSRVPPPVRHLPVGIAYAAVSRPSNSGASSVSTVASESGVPMSTNGWSPITA